MAPTPDPQALRERARWLRRETLALHRLAPETRIASSLSPVEIFVALYYGGVVRHDPRKPRWEGRDRLVVSKGHGSICFYPVLADLGYFDAGELPTICRAGSRLGSIPDPVVPGYESVNGSLGHGLGVACGMALALRGRGREETVFVLLGDGELYEGSVWEAVILAGARRLDNLVAIVDNNRVSMLERCCDIAELEPLEGRFRPFGWRCERVDGHDPAALTAVLAGLKAARDGAPKLLVADTVKGKGVPALERDPLCHLRSLSPAEVDEAIAGLS